MRLSNGEGLLFPKVLPPISPLQYVAFYNKASPVFKRGFLIG